MEISCGEYGDRVPDLVVAAKAGHCSHFQALRKTTNICLGADATTWPPRYDLAAAATNNSKASSSDYCSGSFVGDLRVKETAILDESDNDDGFCASNLTVPCSNSRSSDDNSSSAAAETVSSTAGNVCFQGKNDQS